MTNVDISLDLVFIRWSHDRSVAWLCHGHLWQTPDVRPYTRWLRTNIDVRQWSEKNESTRVAVDDVTHLGVVSHAVWSEMNQWTGVASDDVMPAALVYPNLLQHDTRL